MCSNGHTPLLLDCTSRNAISSASDVILTHFIRKVKGNHISFFLNYEFVRMVLLNHSGYKSENTLFLYQTGVAFLYCY